jgi:hypothetical protein
MKFLNLLFYKSKNLIYSQLLKYNKLSAIVASGKITQLLLAIFFIAMVLFFIQRGRKGIKGKLSRLPVLDGIEMAVGRAAEMGRPVHLSVGRGEFRRGTEAAMTLAGLEVCVYAAQMCARKGASVIFTCSEPAVIPIAEERIKNVYAREGYAESYDKSVSLLFYDRGAIPLAIHQLLDAKKVGAFIWVGYFGYENIFIAEQGVAVGAIQFTWASGAGAASFLVACCEYVLLGSELYAAGAYLSGDPISYNNIIAEDVLKISMLILLGISIILFNVGIEMIKILKY